MVVMIERQTISTMAEEYLCKARMCTSTAKPGCEQLQVHQTTQSRMSCHNDEESNEAQIRVAIWKGLQVPWPWQIWVAAALRACVDVHYLFEQTCIQESHCKVDQTIQRI